MRWYTGQCTVLLRPLGLHCALLLSVAGVSLSVVSSTPHYLGMTGTPQFLAIQATSADSASLQHAYASLAKCQNEGTLKLACLLGSTSRVWEIMDDESDDDDDWAEMETLKKDLLSAVAQARSSCPFEPCFEQLSAAKQRR